MHIQASTEVRAVLFLFVITLTAVAPAVCGAEPMKFHGKPPTMTAILGTAWNIFGDGDIEAGSDERLRQFLREKNIPKRSSLYLHSPGGNLMAGINLGKIIREYELFVYVGKDEKQRPYETASAGECYSACALAFLGGEYRFYKSGSEYGVHRFYAPTKGTNDSDIAQIVSAMIVQYIREMGVDLELFSYMSRAGATELIRLSEHEMERLHVVNGGIHPTKWTMESLGGSIYLKGERQTWRGINKFMLVCVPKGGVVLYVVFDPENRGEEVVKYLNAHSLMINGDFIPISERQIEPAKLVNGWVNARYLLTDDLITRIATARTVGIAMQMVYNAPIFMGFDGMELDDGREKLPGLLNACRAMRSQP